MISDRPLIAKRKKGSKAKALAALDAKLSEAFSFSPLPSTSTSSLLHQDVSRALGFSHSATSGSRTAVKKKKQVVHDRRSDGAGDVAQGDVDAPAGSLIDTLFANSHALHPTKNNFSSISEASPKASVQTVVFSDVVQQPVGEASQTDARQARKQFLSSKTSRLTQAASEASESSNQARKLQGSEADVEDAQAERDNKLNDAELHRLLHTQLFPSLANADSRDKPRALAGRVSEIVDQAPLGFGVDLSLRNEHKGASHTVRQGLLKARKEKQAKREEESRNEGWTPALKGLLQNPLDKIKSAKRRKFGVADERSRGFAMGMGTFSNGVLKLSKAEGESLTSSQAKPRKGKSSKRR